MKLNHRTLSKVAFLVSAMFLVGVVWARAQGGPPDTISYQGYLTDSGGQPIDATVDMQVGFFNVSTGGTAVYTETHSSVTVSQGQFNLDLGSGTSSGTWASAVDFSQALWLEITIDPSGTPETLTPRIPLSTAPYARYAFALADNAVTPPKLNGVSGNGTGGQVLSSDGSGGFSWADAGTLSAGQGITISNNVISTALTAGAGITITNDVISNTLPDPANIIWVAKSGGDYTSIQSALDSIGDASASNPYLLMVAPGVYTEQVTMTQYVDIQGAGEGKTIIRYTGGSSLQSGATVIGANNAEMRFLTVESDGTGQTYSGGIYSSSLDASFSLLHVTATASGGSSYNYGVSNISSSPTMNDVIATASGGTANVGVSSQSSAPKMTNVTATASGGTSSTNFGVENYDSASVMTNVAATATASSGDVCRGIQNSSNSPAVMNNVTATASGCSTENSGLYNIISVSNIRNSALSGSTNSIGGSGAMVATSMLSGTVDSGNTCVGAYNGSFAALGTNCQ